MKESKREKKKKEDLNWEGGYENKEGGVSGLDFAQINEASERQLCQK